jgi:hypothetical protein
MVTESIVTAPRIRRIATRAVRYRTIAYKHRAISIFRIFEAAELNGIELVGVKFSP